MSKPMPFTEDEMKAVFDTNLIEYALSQGFDIEKADRHSYHVRNSGGLFLFPRGFHHFSTMQKGNIIDFAKAYQNLTFIQAVEQILGTKAYANTLDSFAVPHKKQRGTMKLPTTHSDCTATIDYLVNTRCLDEEIVKELIGKGSIFQAVTEHKGKQYKNCAFVGFDKDNQPKYCALRGLYGNFRQDVSNSDKTYGFQMAGTYNRVFVFESPIDAISHATLSKMNGIDYRFDHRISEGCLSDKALTRFLAENPQIKEIVFCYDNDMEGKLQDGTPCNFGQEFAKKCAKKFEEKGYTTFIQTPEKKDFNADLQYIQKSVLKKLKDFKE
ncbi:toprim domain-containing protein [Anaerotignum sp.]|uniref:toprim domain-containing protein n=1 Tax=Anaerotignum sp. TaxID=2039241 RepID=UPI0028AD872B|nr:toprim domain-containing protein [Anaerotignum sp.]